MAFELTLPQLAMSMTEGELAEWLVEDGGRVEEGQPIYSVESDKSTQEIEAPIAGILRHAVPAGQTYQVGHMIGIIE
jgi:pyruvate/2-oxoglutarate dehydrogenase complex dihydrolipoamide acyltransferase (E2) component